MPLTREQKISIIRDFVLWGFIAAVAFHFLMGVVFKLQWPYNSFLFRPRASFSDFFDSLNAIKNMTPYSSGALYSPVAYILIYPFSFIAGEKTPYYVLALLFIFYFVWYAKSNLDTKDAPVSLMTLLVFSFLSYPFLFLVDRGNLDMFIFVFVSIFMILYEQRQYYASLFPLALAIASKTYPITLILLLLAKKQYLGSAIALILTAVVTIIGFLFLQTPFMASWNGWIAWHRAVPQIL